MKLLTKRFTLFDAHSNTHVQIADVSISGKGVEILGVIRTLDGEGKSYKINLGTGEVRFESNLGDHIMSNL